MHLRVRCLRIRVWMGRLHIVMLDACIRVWLHIGLQWVVFMVHEYGPTTTPKHDGRHDRRAYFQTGVHAHDFARVGNPSYALVRAHIL